MLLADDEIWARENNQGTDSFQHAIAEKACGGNCISPSPKRMTGQDRRVAGRTAHPWRRARIPLGDRACVVEVAGHDRSDRRLGNRGRIPKTAVARWGLILTLRASMTALLHCAGYITTAMHSACRPSSPYMHGDYAGGADRTWITASSGSGDVAVSPIYGWASSKTRNRSVASSTPTVATNA